MILYKRNAKNSPIYWSIDEISNGDINISYGVLGGNPHNETILKRLIKANEVESRIKAKRKEGYKQLSEIKDNAPMDIRDNLSLINFLNNYLPKNNTTSDGFVLPMLAKVLKDNKPFIKSTYFGQYKINGVRCLIGAEQNLQDMFTPIRLTYHSREGTDWTDKLYWMDEIILPAIKSDLLDAMIDEGAQLDGELYVPGQSVNNINSFVKNTTLPQHTQLQYWCYDISIDNMSYESRKKFKTENISRLAYTFDTYGQHLNNKSQLVLLPDIEVSSIIDATRFRDKFINLGFEGLILRDVSAEYQFGKRNSAMFKYKRVDDAKFLIIDIVPEGVRTNLCKFILQNDINTEQFECTINADHSRQEYILKNKEKYLGKFAFVEFRERSGIKQVPFHAKVIKVE